jgi:hypothetical protein
MVVFCSRAAAHKTMAHRAATITISQILQEQIRPRRHQQIVDVMLCPQSKQSAILTSAHNWITSSMLILLSFLTQTAYSFTE